MFFQDYLFIKAQPIWETGKCCEMNQTLRFVSDIPSDRTIQLHLACCSQYRVFVDSVFLCSGPARILVIYVIILASNGGYHYLRLAGLDPKQFYKDQESGQILSGDALMNAGPPLQGSFRDLHFRMIHFVAVD